MATIQIKLKDPNKKRIGYQFDDYQILIDGNEPSALTSFQLNMGVGELNTVTLSFFVHDIDIDTDALMALEAHASASKTTTRNRGKPV